jgi:hypothetical protein
MGLMGSGLYSTRTGGRYFYFDTSGEVAGIGEKDFTIHTGSLPVPESYGAEIQVGPFLTLAYSKNNPKRPTLGERLRITAIDYRKDGKRTVYAQDWSRDTRVDPVQWAGTVMEGRPLCSVCGTVPLSDDGGCPCCDAHQCMCRED